MRLHQTLHGYSDGHRLLQSSLDLDSSAKRFLLSMTDMSGPRMVSGFEEYLSGYPIPKSPYYAFAKTWYAKELSRPGCVWTHTLLIEKTKLDILTDLEKLLSLFSRPNGLSDLSRYGRELVIDESLTVKEGSGLQYSPQQMSVETLVQAAFFGLPQKPLFLVAPNARVFEHIPLQIWRAMWPDLRSQYAFCTGSLSNRVIDQTPFGLQIIPRSSLATIRREANGAVFIDEQSKETDVIGDDPEALALEKMLHEPRFIHFVHQYTSDLSGGRELMKVLVSIFRLIEDTRDGSKSISDLTRGIALAFPTSTEAARLKRSIYAPTSNGLLDRMLVNKKEPELLLELMTTQFYDCLNNQELAIASRTRILWLKSKPEAKQLLLNTLELDHNALFDEFLSETASVLSAEDILEISHTKPNLLPLFILNHPKLAASPKLWKTSVDVQREILDVLTEPTHKSSVDWNAVVSAIFAAGAEHLSVTIVERIGLPLFLDILDKINFSSADFSQLWKRAIASKEPLLCKWLESSKSPSRNILVVVALSSEPSSCVFNTSNLVPWIRLADSLESIDSIIRVRIAAFLLALGFSNQDQETYKLVIRSFQIVHDTAEKDNPPYDSWRLLEGLVPELRWTKNWDKCERLIRGLVERYSNGKWPVASFVQVTNREDTLKRLIKRFMKKDDGIQFVKLLKKESGQSEQSSVLRRVINEVARD